MLEKLPQRKNFWYFEIGRTPIRILSAMIKKMRIAPHRLKEDKNLSAIIKNKRYCVLSMNIFRLVDLTWYTDLLALLSLFALDSFCSDGGRIRIPYEKSGYSLVHQFKLLKYRLILTNRIQENIAINFWLVRDNLLKEAQRITKHFNLQPISLLPGRFLSLTPTLGGMERFGSLL